MNEPDYDFWRQERARILSKAFTEYREDIEAGNYLAAIDVILSFERSAAPTVSDTDERVTR